MSRPIFDDVLYLWSGTYIRLENEYEIDFNINSCYQANKLVNFGQIRHYPVVEIVWAWIAPHLRYTFSDSWWYVDYYSKVEEVGYKRYL